MQVRSNRKAVLICHRAFGDLIVSLRSTPCISCRIPRLSGYSSPVRASQQTDFPAFHDLVLPITARVPSGLQRAPRGTVEQTRTVCCNVLEPISLKIGWQMLPAQDEIPVRPIRPGAGRSAIKRAGSFFILYPSPPSVRTAQRAEGGTFCCIEARASHPSRS